MASMKTCQNCKGTGKVRDLDSWKDNPFTDYRPPPEGENSKEISDIIRQVIKQSEKPKKDLS